MCYLHYKPDDEDYDDWPEPGPRPLPCLEWALPVDAAELVDSLKTYEKILLQIQALCLCHRFGREALSVLPQEILDLIVKALYQSTRPTILEACKLKFACFQGRCRRSQHLDLAEDEVEKLWSTCFNAHATCCGRHYLDENTSPSDYGIEKKRKMLDDFIDDDGEIFYEAIYESCYDSRNEGLEMLCLCKSPSSLTSASSFIPLQKILESHFGLKATFLHEVLPDRVRQFLPDTCGVSETSYYTSSFLTLLKKPSADNFAGSRAEAHTNRSFLKRKNFLAFHQRVDPTAFAITEQYQLSFARALRALELQQAFHLSELDVSLTPSNKDDALWSICDAQLPDCPSPSSATLKKKRSRLAEYLDRKNKELGEQSWPQLMLMAASNVVAPTTY